MGLFQWLFSGRERLADVQPEPNLVAVGDRSFVEDAAYMLPKDEREVDRLDMQHYTARFIIHGNHMAPLDKPGRILDVGCGTGRWVIEMAKEFPQAEVVGLDIVKPNINSEARPVNTLFTQRDVLKGLPFTDGVFDYVHMRFLIAALPTKDFLSVINELQRVTRPGGWIELTEPGLLLNTGPGLSTLWKWLFVFGERRNIEMGASKSIAKMLRDAKCTNITYKELPAPVGEHGGQLGRMLGANILSITEAVRMPIISLKIATAEEYDAMLARARTELAQGHCTSSLHIAIGQRAV